MSNGASFVKRSKPRSSATRISSTYEDDDVAAGPSSSSSKLASPSEVESRSADQNGSRSTTPRRTLSALDLDEEDNVGPSSVVFRARAKGARGTPTSAATPSAPSKTVSRKERPAISAMAEDEDDDGSNTFEIRRSKMSIAGKQARKAATATQSVSSGTEAAPKRSTPLRPTSFQAQPLTEAVADPATPSTTSSLYTSKYLEELRSSTPTVKSRARSPNPTSLGPGTRIEDPMVTQTSYISLDDPTNDDALARSKFPSDFAHDSIPSESVIRAAKEKRAKLRVAASADEDFISLAPTSTSSALKTYNGTEVDDGPHPHSRLQREEDEFGDGEEEFAEYTGATERIPIGEKAEKEWKERQRKEMEAAVRGDFDQDDLPNNTTDAVLEEMDEDEVEWERAQLSRTQPLTHSTTSSRPRPRESSPFTPAPNPTATPLPSVGTCSTRLALTLRALEQSTSASAAVVVSTTKELETLDGAERENKLDVVAVEEKASWFDELDEFVRSLARFVEEKVEKVEELDTEGVELAVRRNRMLDRKRAWWLEDRLEQGFGVRSELSVVPDFRKEQEAGEDEDMDTSEGVTLDGTDDVTELDSLSPADEQSYTLAQQSILTRLQTLFSEVQSPEYLHPAATISTTSSPLPFLSSPPAQEDLHPRSVVSRFQEWRGRYPEEYAQVWGGLSVAQIWEFYARLEMIPWSALSSAHSGYRGEWKAGAEAIAQFGWLTGASDYTERAGVEPIGGDEEVLSSLLSNVLVDKLVVLANRGAFSPWSKVQTKEAVEAVDLVQTVLGTGHARCMTLVEAYLGVFAIQIRRLQEVLNGQKQIGAEQAAQEVAQELIDGLLRNLIKWSRVISLSSADAAVIAVAKTFLGLVEGLVGLVMSTFSTHPALASHVGGRIAEVVPKHIAARLQTVSALTGQP